jgi:PAS domain S-box-containing protein
VRILVLSNVTETERQRRQILDRKRELAERNELYRAVIAASFAFVFRIDFDGTLTYLSPSVEDFLGYTADELETRSITTVIPDAEAIELAWQRLEQVSNGEASQLRDLPLETKDGQTVYGDIRAVPIYEADVPSEERTSEDIVGVQGMVRDASERRQLEGLVSVINRVLRHNVRNEMTVISGYAEMLREELDGDAASNAKLIEETAERLLGLSESAQLIEENRTLSPELETIDTVPIVEHTVTQLQTRYPNASVELDTPEAAIAETRSRLETGLWEIVENAAKHGGDAPSIEIGVTVTDSRVVITVADDGPGLPETEREVLETGKETPLAHGQGLGLWLAYWLITNLNGWLEVTEFQAGTTIKISLPKPS